MDGLKELWRRLLFFRNRDRFDRELGEEMRAHLEMKAEELVQSGMSPEEARDAARRSFGPVGQIEERCREARGVPYLDELWQDVRFGARTLRKSPGFTLLAVAALALGIGANTAVFSVTNGVLLRPLPYPGADRLMWAGMSMPDYREVSEHVESFEETSVYASNLYNIPTGDGVEQVLGGTVSPSFFHMLGTPAIGRTFVDADDREPLVVLSDSYWRQRYGGDPAALGQSIVLSGKAHTIVGVMRPEFEFPYSDFKLWVTIGSALGETPEQTENRTLRIFRLVGRLAPGVTQEAAQSELDVLSARLAEQYPASNTGVRIELTSIYDRMFGDVRPALFILLGAVGFILLIGCANVANLMLARNLAREREIAVRTALGAGRWRIARQLLTETLMLAALGAAVGLMFAFLSVELLRRLGIEDLPRGAQVGIDLPVLGFTAAAALLAAVLCGLAPAFQGAKADLNASLKDGGRGSAGGARGGRLRSALVVVEVALSVVVLIGAGLLVRSLVSLLDVQPGFVAERLTTMNVQFVGLEDARDRAASSARALDEIRRIPGVEVAGGATGLPPETPQRVTRYEVADQPDLDKSRNSAYFIATSPDYFRALGTGLLEGRAFDDRDTVSAPKVVMVSEFLAHKLFPDGDAVGKRVKIVNPDYEPEWRTVVGVVGDVRYTGLEDPDQPAIYTPFDQTPFYWMYVMVRGAPVSQSAIRAAVAEADPRLVVANIRPMEQVVAESVSRQRFSMTLLAIFAGLGLALAAVGIYGVVSYAVSQRTREFGVRMALGASPRTLLRLVLGHGLKLGALGVGIGAIAAFAITRLMSSMLFGVTATDPATFAAISALLVGVVLAACSVPALRAARVDPTVAMRNE